MEGNDDSGGKAANGKLLPLFAGEDGLEVQRLKHPTLTKLGW